MGAYDYLPMHERELAAEVDAVLAGIGPVAPEPADTEHLPTSYRVIVATDWGSMTVPFLVLRAYTRIVPAQAPVDLVFALPHQPSRRDLAVVKLLRRSLTPGTRHAGILLESFEDACSQHACAAVVPTGDNQQLMRDVTTALTTLHDLSIMCADATSAAPAPNRADNPALRRRLRAFDGAHTNTW